MDQQWKNLADRKAFPILSSLMDCSDNEHIVLKAVVEVMNRAYGKPTERTEVTGKDGEPLISLEQVMERIKNLKK